MADVLLILGKALELSTPLILAALGGLYSERAGVMNIALEGKMLASACAVALISVASGNPLIGLLVGVLAATLLSLLHYMLTQKFRIDHVVSGMAINVLAIGGCRFAYAQFTDKNRSGEIPHLPEAAYWALAAVMPFAVALYLRQTRPGLRLLAVGNDPDKSREAGINVARVRLQSLAICGLLCGLAGALIVTKTANYSDDMTAGKGFIALAALVVGGWRPLPTLAACLFFALCEAIQQVLQGGKGWLSAIPPQYWNTLPYIATIFALAFLGGKFRVPSGMGKP
ncbi:MAG: ABC transporter permease [Chthonomonas sp.]|nr:ABC transporter permease [Chthonomonas sp.]